MNAESSRLRSTGTTSSDIRAIWPGALLVVYLGVTGALLIAGRSNVRGGEIALHFGALALIAALTWLRAVPDAVRRWVPLVSFLFLYSELPVLIRAAGHVQTFDVFVMQWDAAIFGGQPAQAWAARFPQRALSELLHLAYFAYYPIIYSVPAALYLSRRLDEFGEAAFALLLTFSACFLAYIAFPVAGPRYYWPSSAPNGFTRDIVVAVLESGSSRGTAFPSSHVAVAVAQSILAIRYFGVRGAPIPIVTAGLAVGAIYGGFHYAIDVVAGAVLGGCTVLLGIAAAKRMPLREGQRSDVPAPNVGTGERIEQVVERQD